MKKDIQFKSSVSGHFTLFITRNNGEREKVAEFENLITNQGINRLGSGANGMFEYCHVGSGSAAPQFSDTGLQSYIGYNNGGRSVIAQGVQATTSPYYTYSRYNFRFQNGQATGNLSEIGVGWVSNGPNLFSRTLIKDSNGNPTTITVLSDEILDVVYEVRMYPPMNDITGTISISGVDYSIITRAAQLIWTNPEPLSLYGFTNGVNFSIQAHTGDINPSILGLPSGSAIGLSGTEGSMDPYSNNSLQRTGRFVAGVNNLNSEGGIRSIVIFSSLGNFQTQFEPRIPKDNTKRLTMEYSFQWGRRAP